MRISRNTKGSRSRTFIPQEIEQQNKKQGNYMATRYEQHNP